MDDVVISTEGLVKRFKDVVALDHVSLRIQRGEVFGLLGPNGAMRCLMSLSFMPNFYLYFPLFLPLYLSFISDLSNYSD